MVHLYWCRVHNGEFGELRRSGEGVALDPTNLATPGSPTLELRGRVADSLVLAVDAGIVPVFEGGPPAAGRFGWFEGFGWQGPYTGWPVESGWRYDLADDDALLLPLLITPKTPVLQPANLPSPPLFGGLAAYPFFVYFTPGAPLTPLSPFAPAVAVASRLLCHCRFDEALRWYRALLRPLQSDNFVERRTTNNRNHGASAGGVARGPRNDAVLGRRRDGRPQRRDAARPATPPSHSREARVIYDAATRILGPTPTTVLPDRTSDPRKPPRRSRRSSRTTRR